MEVRSSEPEQLKDRIIFMSMYNAIELDKKGNKATCIANSESVSQYATRFPKGCWSFLGQGFSRIKVRNAHVQTRRTMESEEMMDNLSKSRHPVFREQVR